MKIWLVSLTVEIEAENEDAAMQEAMRLDDTVSVNAATEIGEYDNE